MSKVISKRERFADKIYITLQILSRLLFIVLGIIGLAVVNYYYSIAGIAIGFIIGKWIRYSLGINKKIEFDGFYERMKERARGGLPRLLERFMEKLRGNAFTHDKCIRISEAYLVFKQKSKSVNSEEELLNLLAELDNKTKEISYAKK